MGFLSMATLAVGVVLSAVSGLVCYMGSASISGHVSGLPGIDLVMSHPAAALAVGGLITVISAFGQPSRVD